MLFTIIHVHLHRNTFSLPIPILSLNTKFVFLDIKSAIWAWMFSQSIMCSCTYLFPEVCLTFVINCDPHRSMMYHFYIILKSKSFSWITAGRNAVRYRTNKISHKMEIFPSISLLKNTNINTIANISCKQFHNYSYVYSSKKL